LLVPVPRLLTQHALALPGVVVPGLDAVLDLCRDAVGVHVLDGAVHGGPVVVLPGGRGSHHVSHLRPTTRLRRTKTDGGLCDVTARP